MAAPRSPASQMCLEWWVNNWSKNKDHADFIKWAKVATGKRKCFEDMSDEELRDLSYRVKQQRTTALKNRAKKAKKTRKANQRKAAREAANGTPAATTPPGKMSDLQFAEQWHRDNPNVEGAHALCAAALKDVNGSKKSESQRKQTSYSAIAAARQNPAPVSHARKTERPQQQQEQSGTTGTSQTDSADQPVTAREYVESARDRLNSVIAAMDSVGDGGPVDETFSKLAAMPGQLSAANDDTMAAMQRVNDALAAV